MSCKYCSESIVKGSILRYRDLDIVETEIRFLLQFGLTRFMMIASEINADSNAYFLELAERIIQINKQQPSYKQVTWHAFYLMTLDAAEIRQLRRSGFLGGTNCVVSFDDANLLAIEAPHKVQTLIEHLMNVKRVFQESNQVYPSLEERIFRNTPFLGFKPFDNFMNNWNFFLGNFYATPETIRRTLQTVDDMELSSHFDSCYVNKATRILDHMDLTEDYLRATKTVRENGTIASYDELAPSFLYPPALMHHFASASTYEKFLIHIQQTYLSTRHLFNKNWNWFLYQNIAFESFCNLWNIASESDLSFKTITTIPEVQEKLTALRSASEEELKQLFNPPTEKKLLMNHTAHMAIRLVFKSQEDKCTPVLDFLDLPPVVEAGFESSSFKIAQHMFKKAQNKEIFLTLLKNEVTINIFTAFFVEYLLYLHNFTSIFSGEYRQFFLRNNTFKNSYVQ